MMTDRAGYVYFLSSADGQSVKIGFSNQVEKRVASLDASSGALSLIGYMPGSMYTERWLHEKFASDRTNGEWFRYSATIRAFVYGVGLIGGPAQLDRREEGETPTKERELIARVMVIARGEARRYLHAILLSAAPELRKKPLPPTAQRRLDALEGEKKHHGDRIRAGLVRARENGKQLGRRKRDYDVARLHALREQGLSIREISKAMQLPRSTVADAVKFRENPLFFLSDKRP